MERTDTTQGSWRHDTRMAVGLSVSALEHILEIAQRELCPVGTHIQALSRKLAGKVERGKVEQETAWLFVLGLSTFLRKSLNVSESVSVSIKRVESEVRVGRG